MKRRRSWTNKAVYRAVFNFHEEREAALKARTPLYWEETCAGMTKLSAMHGHDPFLIDLLCAVHADLERKYKEVHT